MSSSSTKQGNANAKKLKMNPMEYNTVDKLVELSFNKRFTFKIDRTKWVLPDRYIKENNLNDTPTQPTIERWQLDELKELKVNLNRVKSKLNSFNFKSWHKHTNNRNPAGLLMKNLRCYEIELLTQAWCKFYELLNVYNLASHDVNTTIRTFHLCEAPGAFVSALNYYLKLNYPKVEWEWVASTLNPYHEGNPLHEMINDDRFISKTLNNWWFGEDHTGNLHHLCNFKSLKEFSTSYEPISFVTADGSVDCGHDPAEQENYVLPLQYTETIAGLSILSKGGNFVIKLFTTYECETVCLLFLLCCVFKSVSIHKPVASKEGNSEVYVICNDYLGKDSCKGILDSAHYYGSFPSVLFSLEELPESFIHEVIRCSQFFTDIQISALERNISTYQRDSGSKQKSFVWKLKNTVSENFIKLFNVRPLFNCLRILKGYNIPIQLHLDGKNEEGSHEERVGIVQTDSMTFLFTNKRNLETFNDTWNWGFVYWITDLNINVDAFKLEIIKGEPINCIQSSKFCRGTALKAVKNLNKYGIVKSMLANKPDLLNEMKDELTLLSCNYSVLNVGNMSWFSDYRRAQKECLEYLIEELSRMELESSFVLLGLPLLTQFNIGLLFILGLSYSKSAIINPEFRYGLFFNKMDNFQFLTIFNDINKQLDDLRTGVISLVPISCILDGDWYKIITITNHLVIKNTALNIIINMIDEGCQLMDQLD